jgi:hypothetical protein
MMTEKNQVKNKKNIWYNKNFWKLPCLAGMMPPPQSFLLLLLCLKPLPGIYIWTNSKGSHSSYPHAVKSRSWLARPPLRPFVWIWDETITLPAAAVSQVSARYERKSTAKVGTTFVALPSPARKLR